jgi:hypothetical protein
MTVWDSEDQAHTTCERIDARGRQRDGNTTVAFGIAKSQLKATEETAKRCGATSTLPASWIPPENGANWRVLQRVDQAVADRPSGPVHGLE